MPFVTRVLNASSTGPNIRDLVSSLHRELSLVATPIAADETSNKAYGPATQATVRDFQRRFGLRETGDLDPVSGGIMALATLAIEERDREKLRREIRNAANRLNDSPEYNYWLARFAIMAGDYQIAYSSTRRFSDFGPVVNVIDAALGITKGPGKPEDPHPENFYTYRHELFDRTQLAQFRRAVGELTISQYKLDLGIPPNWEVPAADFEDAKQDSVILLEAMEEWQDGIQDSFNRQYSRAAIHYDNCQRALVRYFQAELALNVTGNLDQDLASILNLLITSEAYKWAPLWASIRSRKSLLALKEIYEHDWVYPRGTDDTFSKAGKYVVNFFNFNDVLMSVPTPGSPKMKVETRIIGPLVVIAFVLVPLARAEDNRMRRQFDAALQELDELIGRNTTSAPEYRLICEFIELPFIQMLRAETLLDKADSQFKARTVVTPEDSYPEAAQYHNMLAAKTYLEVFKTFAPDEQYVPNVQTARDRLKQRLRERIDEGDTDSREFHAIIKGVTIPNVSPVGTALPGLDRRKGPHETLVNLKRPLDQPPIRETNPRVYALLLEAQARLEQLKSGFNYFGYSDDYVPPWRFSFLLDRARYFTEHARSAQREYLNFLQNAEREEFQELSAAQNVELEKSNIRIETARVDQVRSEVAVAYESSTLAQVSATNSELRLGRYIEFDKRMDELESTSLMGSLLGGLAGAAITGLTGGAAAGLLAFGAWAAQAASAQAETTKAGEQRALEKYNLGLSILEANQAKKVADAQLAAAEAGLLVASLQRQAALLRHEFALQNLNFLHNRTLNAELWYRLSNAIRSVSEIYLRYAIEMAFLAEQAYEFEADKRINAIRFDYDVSDIGDMLAGDFLLRDLDTLEQDLVVGQRLRQQQVRYVLSLAREFPEALKDLRDNGQTFFSLRLEQLERRFPGLYNLRITSVEVLPVALMDPTRFSLELTHAGAGQVRIKAQPDTPPGTDSTSPLNTGDFKDWLEGLESTWPVKIRVTGRETAVYSGLTRQELAALPSLFVSNQRGGFEGLAAASAWKIDFSKKENRIVPDTLADLLITFTLSAYYDGSLRETVDRAPRKTASTTTWFSGHQDFPDDFYEFNRSGTMQWQVAPDSLGLWETMGELRNVAVICSPSQKRPELGRLMCSYPIELEVNSAGTVRVLRALPRFSLQTNALMLDATINTPSGSSVTFDFGDGTPIADNTALPHTYARPGKYDVVVRIAANGRLTEYRTAVIASREHPVKAPLILSPTFRATVNASKVTVRPTVQIPAGESLTISWRIPGQNPDPDSDPVTFTLDPGRYVIQLLAVRRLKARFHSQQRHGLTNVLPLGGLHLATNRTFDAVTGNETTTALNGFGQHVFNSGVLSPADQWTFELTIDDNPHIVSVSSNDTTQVDLSELSDVVLALEYAVQDR